MTSGVYVIECDGKQYVGSARDIAARWGVHRNELRHNKHHSPYMQRAWNKYGEDTFTFRILEPCADDLCIEREQHWIDTLAPVFNVHPLARSPRGVKRSAETRAKLSALASNRAGPMTGKRHTEATKAKMRGRHISDEARARLRARTVTDETRAKISAARKGKPRDPAVVEAAAAKVRGKSKPPGFGERVRASLTGVKHSEERRAKNREAHIGQVVSPEQRAKISESLKGRPSPLKGRTLTPEHREKVVAALRAYQERQRGQ